MPIIYRLATHNIGLQTNRATQKQLKAQLVMGLGSTKLVILPTELELEF